MNPTYDFKGQVALVTGASSGMGLTTARTFAAAGASVVLADVNENGLAAAVDNLKSDGYAALGVPSDVNPGIEATGNDVDAPVFEDELDSEHDAQFFLELTHALADRRPRHAYFASCTAETLRPSYGKKRLQLGKRDRIHYMRRSHVSGIVKAFLTGRNVV